MSGLNALASGATAFNQGCRKRPSNCDRRVFRNSLIPIDLAAPMFHVPKRNVFEQVLAEVRAFARRTDFDDDVCVIGVEVARSIGGSNGQKNED